MMTRIRCLALAMAGLLAGSAGSAMAADVGVSISIGQPGLYGRIDIGRFPYPELVYRQPVIVAPPRVVRPQPVYMWVPPGHRSDWRRYCGRYGACGVPVAFVTDDWYHHHVRGRGYDRGHDHDRYDDRGHKPGKGKGHGHSKGRGHGWDDDHRGH